MQKIFTAKLGIDSVTVTFPALTLGGVGKSKVLTRVFNDFKFLQNDIFKIVIFEIAEKIKIVVNAMTNLFFDKLHHILADS